MIDRLPRAGLAVTAFAVAAIGAWLLWNFDPSAPGSLFPPCVFRLVTGYYCPGCGLTRMLHALVHGDVARAASMNVLALAGLPVLGAIAVDTHYDRRLLRGRMRSLVYAGRFWLVAALVFGVLRNLPWAPFTALAPI